MAKQFSQDEFSGDEAGGLQLTGRIALTSDCSDTYCQRADVEFIYGKNNIFNWADINASGSLPEVAARVCWACGVATQDVTDRLRGSVYAMPFDDPIPAQVVEKTARLAGVLLYDSRGIVDMGKNDEPIHQLSAHRKMVDKFLNDVLSGRVRLDAPVVSGSYPRNVRDDCLLFPWNYHNIEYWLEG